MDEVADLRASVEAILDTDLTGVPTDKVVELVRQRMAALEPYLSGGEVFGMPDLEHEMLSRFIALLQGPTEGQSVH